MKLIMENWKSFIVENKKQEIIDLKYGELKRKNHRKRLAEEPKVIDIKLSDIPITKFPANESDAVKKELKTVLNAMVDKGMSKEELKETDEKPIKMFTKYLKENDLDNISVVEDIAKDVAIISLRLKMRYDRPRPEQLGPLVGYDIKSIKTDTDDTPSYPSGHTMQAWTIAYYLESKYPEHKKDLYDIAEKIEKSRIIRGAHYPSDNKEAKSIAKKYLLPNIKEKK